MPWRNVFESDLRLPERVCIVAPGPHGAGHYHEIPQGCFIIAVSKAVQIPGLDPDLWMMNHADQDWYAAADRAFRGIRVFKRDAALQWPDTVAMRDDMSGRQFYFDPPEECLGLQDFVPVDGCIRIGATISACAIQLAYNFGAREILLCGVDMSGDGYYDGSMNPHPHHGAIWPATSRLNVLMQWLRSNRGIRFRTLSPTALDVPVS